MYSTPKIEEKVTKEILGPHRRHMEKHPRLYPQSIRETKLRYNSRKLPSDVGSSGPVSPCETPGASITQMESMLLRSSRGETFAKIARRNPQGWQKIVKAQLEHEKFLNSMRFYDRVFQNGSDEPLDHGPATIFQHAKFVPEEREKQGTRLKSFQIPWKKNATKSKFVSPAEQKKLVFKSFKDISVEPPQTPPPEENNSKDTPSGQSETDRNQNTGKTRKKDAMTTEVERKPYASLASKMKPLPLRVKRLSVLKKTEKVTKGPITPSFPFPNYSLPRESFHNQMQAGLLSRAERVDVGSPKTNLSILDSMRLQFSLNSRKSPSSSYYQVHQFHDSEDLQFSNSQEPGPSNSQQKQSSNFQISPASPRSLNSSKSLSQQSHISSNSPKSPTSSEVSSNSKDSLYLRRRLLKEAADQSSENMLQKKFDDARLKEKQEDLHFSSSSFSNLTSEMRQPRMYQRNPLLPVFIQSPYYQRMSTDDREYIKELQRKLDDERAEEAEADEITKKMFSD